MPLRFFLHPGRQFTRTLCLLVVCLTLLLSVPTTTFAAATAPISLSTTSGPPLALVRIHGSGFGATEAITITFDSRTVGSATTSGTGTFSTTFSVLRDAQPSNYASTHTVLATGHSSGRAAEAFFDVQTDWRMAGFDAQNTHENPVENVLSTSNASRLLAGWHFNTTGRYPGSCPIIAQGLAYLGSSDGHLYALDAYTGSQKWSIALGSTYTANSCPAVVNHILYIGTNSGSLLALNATTGMLVWSVKTLSQIESSPVVMNGLVYISSFDNHLYAFNARTGAQVWSFASTTALTTTPAVQTASSTWEHRMGIFMPSMRRWGKPSGVSPPPAPLAPQP